MSNEVVAKKYSGTTSIYLEDNAYISKQDLIWCTRSIDGPLPAFDVETREYAYTGGSPNNHIRHDFVFWMNFPSISIMPWLPTTRAAMAAFFPIILRYLVTRKSAQPIQVTTRRTGR